MPTPMRTTQTARGTRTYRVGKRDGANARALIADLSAWCCPDPGRCYHSTSIQTSGSISPASAPISENIPTALWSCAMASSDLPTL